MCLYVCAHTRAAFSDKVLFHPFSNFTIRAVFCPVLLKSLLGGDPIYVNRSLRLPFKCVSGLFSTSVLDVYYIVEFKKIMRKAVLRLPT